MLTRRYNTTDAVTHERKTVTVDISRNTDDGYYYSAVVKEMPGLIATGETLPELELDLAGAMEEWDITNSRRDNNLFVFSKQAFLNMLSEKLDNPTSMKISKMSYLCSAYYAGTYGTLEDYPDFLISSDYVASKYGMTDSYFLGHKIEDKPKLKLIFNATLSDNQKHNIRLFIDNFLKQGKSVDDFSLVLRTKEDSVWKDNYVEGNNTPVSLEDIKSEYINKVNNRGEK
ncbi:hypothetical protein RND61_15470 [Streptomyces sp. TRM76323]|uniref:Uncharacterized protein n=1 Tax=Streptomyces tamarix TaxID=3078565 RepID=A0ABU3QL25_9ACTN|nr:hypothetical protein [Streptomyces tamarix]MDT9683447.1 hypothetical protein [Streptomyces tamarix]